MTSRWTTTMADGDYIVYADQRLPFGVTVLTTDGKQWAYWVKRNGDRSSTLAQNVIDQWTFIPMKSVVSRKTVSMLNGGVRDRYYHGNTIDVRTP